MNCRGAVHSYASILLLIGGQIPLGPVKIIKRALQKLLLLLQVASLLFLKWFDPDYIAELRNATGDLGTFLKGKEGLLLPSLIGAPISLMH